MTKLLKPHDYNTSVFINCPYDSAYEPLLHGIVFAVHHMNLKPKLALDSVDAGHPRLEKIFHLIQNCKYSIHDLSRTQLDPNHGFPRFNMAFELGLDLGCKRFGKRHHEEKTALILDHDRYRYRSFISDIAGLDIEEHNGSVASVITVVRNWLRHSFDTFAVLAPSGSAINGRYQSFQRALPKMCKRFNWDVDNLPYADFSWAVHDWIENNPHNVQWP